jgi:hypothetical protein
MTATSYTWSSVAERASVGARAPRIWSIVCGVDVG